MAQLQMQNQKLELFKKAAELKQADAKARTAQAEANCAELCAFLEAVKAVKAARLARFKAKEEGVLKISLLPGYPPGQYCRAGNMESGRNIDVGSEIHHCSKWTSTDDAASNERYTR